MSRGADRGSESAGRAAHTAFNRFGSLQSLIDIFAHSAHRSVIDFGAAELAQLESGHPTVESLAWLPVTEFERISSFCDVLAQRGKNRWAINATQRAELIGYLGGAPALANPRILFCLAAAIDRNFDTRERSPEESSWHLTRGVVRPPEAFLAGSANPPPRIGQMTSFAVVRRWFSNLWLAPHLDRFEAFGRVPESRSIPLEPSIARRFAEARQADELRLALVTWPRHSRGDLMRATEVPKGCFAIDSVHRTSPLVFEPLLSVLAEQRIHVAVLPELSLTPDELGQLTVALRRRAAKYPLLITAGLTHGRRGATHVNEAVVVDALGREIFRHEKLEPFTDSEFGIEHIVPRTSQDYAFLDTAIGRIIVNVCRDFRSDIPLLLNRLLEGTLFLVPAYSSRLDFVTEEAPLLGQRQLAITAAANASMGDLRDATYLYVPIRGERFRKGFPSQHADLPGAGSVATVTTFSISFGDERCAQVTGPGVFRI